LHHQRTHQQTQNDTEHFFAIVTFYWEPTQPC